MGQKKPFNAINIILFTLWFIGLIVAALLVHYAIFKIGFHNAKEISPLIGAFAILISAGIASASVMKSINATQQNEKQKAENEKERKRLFAFNVMKTIHMAVNVQGLKPNKDNFELFHTQFTTNMETVSKLINSIFCDPILPFLIKEEQAIISELYNNFNEYFFITRLVADDKFIEAIKKYKEQFGAYAEKYIQLYEQTDTKVF